MMDLPKSLPTQKVDWIYLRAHLAKAKKIMQYVDISCRAKMEDAAMMGGSIACDLLKLRPLKDETRRALTNKNQPFVPVTLSWNKVLKARMIKECR